MSLAWNVLRHEIVHLQSSVNSENEIFKPFRPQTKHDKNVRRRFFYGWNNWVCMYVYGSRKLSIYITTFSIWQGIQLGKRTKTICHFWFSLTSFDHVWKNKRIFIFEKGWIKQSRIWYPNERINTRFDLDQCTIFDLNATNTIKQRKWILTENASVGQATIKDLYFNKWFKIKSIFRLIVCIKVYVLIWEI